MADRGQHSKWVSRRDLLRAAGLAAAGAGLASTAAPAAGRGFEHRLLLGWIDDNSNRPLAGKRWPITDIDEQTVKDYRSFLRTARDYGYNGITLWGLYASHAWAVPLENSLTPGRRRLIDRILSEAAKMGIKVLYGLGVYSWGFEEIIKHDPTTARNEGRMVWGSFQPDNGVAMCYHSQSARRWIARNRGPVRKRSRHTGVRFPVRGFGTVLLHSMSAYVRHRVSFARDQ